MFLHNKHVRTSIATKNYSIRNSLIGKWDSVNLLQIFVFCSSCQAD